MKKQAKKTQVKISVNPAIETPMATPASQSTEAEKIWAEVKDCEISMFGLAGQTVATYCSYYPISPTECHLRYKVSSVIPAVEAAVAKHFTIESTDKYIILTRKVGK